MAFISFKEATSALTVDLRAEFRTNAPFAQTVALTRTAVKCRDLMKDHMREKFKKVTPYALNQVGYLPATKQTKTSEVFIKYFDAGKGTPGTKFLGPEIIGGDRGQKRSERALSFAGILPPGGFYAPGAKARLDHYGNMSRGQIVQALSALRAFGEQGYTANRARGQAKKSAGGEIFAIRYASNRHGLKPGVYLRTKSGPLPIMKFIARPHYQVRLPFFDLVEADAARIFIPEYERALREFAPK